MKDYVADTHGLFWYLTASPRLGRKAKAVFDAGANGMATIYIPAIVLSELYYLNVKLGLPLVFADVFQKLDASEQFDLISFEPNDVLYFDRDVAVREMHDRLVVGVCRRLNAPCLTIDESIVKSGLVEIVW